VEFANSVSEDGSGITQLLYVSYFLHTIQTFVFFVSFSYVIGMTFYICSLQNHFTHEMQILEADPAISKVEMMRSTFIADFEQYPLNDMDKSEGCIRAITVATYYGFTSMSTVGFGDLYPRSDFERIIVVIMFILANGIFAFSLQEFSKIVENYNELSADIDYSADLVTFFAVIEHFNLGNDIGLAKRREYEEYFAYRWRNDRNGAINDEDEKALMMETPIETQVNLIVRSLHRVFMNEFQQIFHIQKSAPDG
jgi:hypothetical protein